MYQIKKIKDYYYLHCNNVLFIPNTILDLSWINMNVTDFAVEVVDLEFSQMVRAFNKEELTRLADIINFKENTLDFTCIYDIVEVKAIKYKLESMYFLLFEGYKMFYGSISNRILSKCRIDLKSLPNVIIKNNNVSFKPSLIDNFDSTINYINSRFLLDNLI